MLDPSRIYFTKEDLKKLERHYDKLDDDLDSGNADFAFEVFKRCHEENINTCLDTSGCVLNEGVLKLLCETDRVLLDVKYTEDEVYVENVGTTLYKTLDFLKTLDKMKIPTTLRQVIIPTVNDSEENILHLKEIGKAHSCVNKIELLPFRKICENKYENMGIPFPFAQYETPTKEKMNALQDLLGVR